MKTLPVFLSLAITSPALGAPFTIHGNLEFDAAYDALSLSAHDVPSGVNQPLPRLHVCAYHSPTQTGDGRVDFQQTDFPISDDDFDDVLLGCTVADDAGAFVLDATIAAAHKVNIYLATTLCDGDYRGEGSEAEVCIRLSDPEVDPDRPENLKVIWSKVYPLRPQVDQQISWNLSCPNEPGSGADTVVCSTPQTSTWEDSKDDSCRCDVSKSWKDCAYRDVCTPGTPCDDENSRTGCNMEAVHAYRASVQPLLTIDGTMKPNATNTDADGGFGGDATAATYCDHADCQDEVQVHLLYAAHDPDTITNAPPPCESDLTSNGADDYDTVCILTPFAPWRVVHELGHVVDMRWRASGMGHQNLALGSAHSFPDPLPFNQRMSFREGWANIWASAAWQSDDTYAPMYCNTNVVGIALEDDQPECSTDVSSEDDVSRVLWDLYDANDSYEAEDTIRLSMYTLRRAMSAWRRAPADQPGGTEEEDWQVGGSREQSNGNNLLDFVERLIMEDPTRRDSICDLLEQSCMDDGYQSVTLADHTDYADLCP